MSHAFLNFTEDYGQTTGRPLVQNTIDSVPEPWKKWVGSVLGEKEKERFFNFRRQYTSKICYNMDKL